MNFEYRSREEILIEVLEAALKRLNPQIEANEKRSKDIIEAPSKLIELRQKALKKIEGAPVNNNIVSYLDKAADEEKRLLKLMKRDFLSVDEKVYDLKQKRDCIINEIARLAIKLDTRR